MKRRHVHLLFGLSAVVFATAAGYNAAELVRAQRINQAIASASASGLDTNIVEAVFARAVALSGQNDYEAAVKTYKSLVQNRRTDIRRAALYNLGNLHLRQALRAGAETSLEPLPLVELAKRTYRDLLREDPAHWDARYNLERALRLAPEVADDLADADRPTNWQRRVIRALPDFRLELP